MMAFHEPGVSTITACCCTQLLKSELLLSVIGYSAHLDPCPILIAQAKEDAAASFSRERIRKLIGSTLVLRKRFDPGVRMGEDSLRFKQFEGGFLAVESAGSPMNLAMRAVKITLLDEIDKYEMTKEGDPVTLAEERKATFGANAKHIRCCSHTRDESKLCAFAPILTRLKRR
jgi:phage terminase large subunit GpA-like protein